MDNDKNSNAFEPQGGAYDSGVKSLVKSLQTAFILLVIVILGMLIYFISFGGYFAVKAQEAVIVLQFGKYKDTYTKDWHWFLPYPVNRFVHVPVSPQELTVSFRASESLLPGAPPQPLKPGRDRYLLTAGSQMQGSDGPIQLGPNILHATWAITYRVTDPYRYYESCLTAADPLEPDQVIEEDGVKLGRRGPQTMLENLFRQAAVKVTGSFPINDILYSRNAEYSGQVQSEFSRLVTAADIGISIDSARLVSVDPPALAKAAFDEVAVALNRKTSLENEAQVYKMQAEGEGASQAAAIIADARAYRSQVVSEVKAESGYFTSIQKEYLVSPETVLMALYNNALTDVLSSLEDKYIVRSGAGVDAPQVRIRLNPEMRKNQKSGEQ